MERDALGPDRPTLHQARVAAGLTLGKLSRRVGISMTAMSRMENGMLSPSLRTVHAVEQALGQGRLVWPGLSEGVRAQLRVVELEEEVARLRALLPRQEASAVHPLLSDELVIRLRHWVCLWRRPDPTGVSQDQREMLTHQLASVVDPLLDELQRYQAIERALLDLLRLVAGGQSPDEAVATLQAGHVQLQKTVAILKTRLQGAEDACTVLDHRAALLRPVVDEVKRMLDRGKAWKMKQSARALWDAMIAAGEIECTGVEDREDYWDLGPCAKCKGQCEEGDDV